MHYCTYYQAVVPERANHMKLVGILKYYDHLCFDRTLDASHGLFEFFVPPAQEQKFKDIMHRLVAYGIIKQFEKKENRLQDNMRNDTRNESDYR